MQMEMKDGQLMLGVIQIGGIYLKMGLRQRSILMVKLGLLVAFIHITVMGLITRNTIFIMKMENQVMIVQGLHGSMGMMEMGSMR